MSERISQTPKIRLHVALTPSETVANALRHFANDEKEGVRAYTRAYTTLDSLDYGVGAYDNRIDQANSFLKRPLARSALFLTEQLELEEQEDGSTRLYLQPRNQYQVIALEAAIKKVGELEGSTGEHDLYVEFSKNNAIPPAKRGEAKERFSELAHNPTKYAQLRLDVPRLAFRHIIESSMPQTPQDQAS